MGAKSALSKRQMRIHVARDIRSAWDDLPIHDELHAFAAGYRQDPKLFQSLVVLFRAPDDLCEPEFERHMWARIQSLTDKDVWRGAQADARVATAGDSPHFSLSFGARPSSRWACIRTPAARARRFSTPAIVFNLHDQFERLRADGLYEKLRATILERDEALQGSINPMLTRHGEVSEARQYSGRAVDDDWRCPLHRPGTGLGGRRPAGAARVSSDSVQEIAPRSGVAFLLDKGERLTVIDPQGEQVADLLAYAREDVREVISSGRTLDYASRIYLTTGDKLYSNRSRVLLEIEEDTVGRHDFLLTPCSADTFRIIYGDAHPHRGCFSATWPRRCTPTAWSPTPSPRPSTCS